MVDREVLGEAGVKEVEREERESSRLVPPPPLEASLGLQECKWQVCGLQGDNCCRGLD